MKYHTHGTQPQTNRIYPAIIEEVGVSSPNYDIPTYEIIESKSRIDWGGVVIQLGGKGMDKGADITRTLIIEFFGLLRTIVKCSFWLIGTILKMFWDWWTMPMTDRYDNCGQYKQPNKDNRTYHIHHHY